MKTSCLSLPMSLTIDSSRNELDAILAKLRYLDVSEEIVYESSLMKAHGGYCDIFIGWWVNRGRRICRVAIKRLRVQLYRERDFAKVGNIRSGTYCQKSDQGNSGPLVAGQRDPCMVTSHPPKYFTSSWFHYRRRISFPRLRMDGEWVCVTVR